jgi:hypothetical protein
MQRQQPYEDGETENVSSGWRREFWQAGWRLLVTYIPEVGEWNV